MDNSKIARFQLVVWLAMLPLFIFGLADQAIAFAVGRFEPWLNLVNCLLASITAAGFLALCPLLGRGQ